MNEDEVIAAYVRANYPEILDTPAYYVFKAAYTLIVPTAKKFIEAAQNLISVLEGDKNE